MDVNRKATLYSLECHCHTNECRKQSSRRRCPRNWVGDDGRDARAGRAAIGELVPLCLRAEPATINNIGKASDRRTSPRLANKDARSSVLRGCHAQGKARTLLCRTMRTLCENEV